jgi:F-type H+-transporting ATPase subunit gamma
MPSLKDLRNRIDSVKSTKKITQAMKMVAASKLKKAQAFAEKGRNYSSGLEGIVKGLVSSSDQQSHPLLVGIEKEKKQSLLVVVSSDRGLCGGLNSNIVKNVRKKLVLLKSENKKTTLICIGKKGYDQLVGINQDMFDFEVKYLTIGEMDYKTTEELGNKILSGFYDNKFDECIMFYNFFKSVIAQEIRSETLIPYPKEEKIIENDQEEKFYEYEPDEDDVLDKILPKNFIVQMYKAILESRASEQGARMTAMDNATRNAGEMIDSLSLKYNRQRQAIITKELIEIISGAEAL